MGAHVLKATFTRGAVSPLAHARRDIEMYQAAAAELRNWHVLREGGVRRRSGTKFRGFAKVHNQDVRLVPFVFSRTQAYALEFSNELVRFWTKDGQVYSGTTPYEVVSPYAVADLPSVQYVQSSDVMFVALRSMTQKPQKLVRTGHTSWAFSDVEFRDGPYLPINDTRNSVATSGAPTDGGTTTLTFSSALGINGGSGFVSTDVDRHIRVQFDGNWSWGTIAAVTSATEIEVDWVTGSGGTTDSYTWRLGAFSDTTGYPGSVAIFEGRLLWASTPTSPNYVGYSYSNIPESYTPSDVDGTVTDAHGGAYDIIGGDEILWLQDAPRLQIGMARAIKSLGASDLGQQFGPRNVTVKTELAEGVSQIRPVTIGPSTVHAERFGQSINDLYYDYQVNSLIRPEISTTAEHLFFASVKELAFAQLPYRRLWALLEDGTLATTTVDRYEKVIGFSSQDIGAGVVKTIAAVPGERGDDVWMVVRRFVNGGYWQSVETVSPDFLRGDVSDCFYHDCGATYNGVPTATVSDIYWLKNTTVSILADGVVLPNTVVNSDGILTLPNGKTASKISFGIPIEAYGKLLPSPLATPEGASLGRKLKIVGAEVDVYETKGLRVISDREQRDLLKESPAARKGADTLKTGPYRIMVDGDWASQGQLAFVADTPLPATVRAINVHVVTE